MQAATIRSGLVESTHPWSAVVVDASGTTLHEWGDADRPLYYRSSVKAFQATISQECGADLPPEHLAVACSSHSGTAAHVATVRAMLHAAGLDESSLQCPADMPLGEGPRRLLLGVGAGPRRIFHNCSGKHAGFLRACAAQGWPLETYLHPDHPLQRRVTDLLIETTGVNGTPAGVDGCGAPTLRGSIRGLARAFARLTVDPRFVAARTAMSTYPALTSGNDRPDGRFAMWWGGPAKGGAQGIMAAARNGTAIATKSHSGSISVAVQALIEVARRIGMLPDAAAAALAADHAPAVTGGSTRVGSIVAAAEGTLP